MTKILYFIIAVAFLDTFIQLPIITPYAQNLGASHFLTGAIIAVYSLANMVGNLLAGHWIDRFGRKKLLLSGMLLVAIILIFYPLTRTGLELFIVRLLHGLAGGALIPAAFAYVGDKTRTGERGRTMAYTGACIGSAAIIGPALGGAIAARGSADAVFLLVAGLFILTSILIVTHIKESYIPSDRGHVQGKDILFLLKEPLIITACLSAFALMVSNGTLAFALPLVVASVGLSTATTGMLLSLFGIVALVIFLTPANRLFDKKTPVSLVITGIIFISVALTLLSMVTALPMLIIAMIIYGIGFAFIFPSMNKIVADVSSEVDRGKAYGIFYAAFSLGVVSGSFIAGTAAELSFHPFLVSAIIMLSVAGLVILSARYSHYSSSK
ncbi:MFS transporter [Salipaludibacillus agaradhaerens]|uniref:MFS transporter n=1 Tax=Salipaludibacillus agaradhaerens TaxID=76935 RepID=UPI002151B86A|nr:MFS transporter [Salipaludibacillus agaradhaerens]MCR6106890.1 MFS transporter [Salipaludibacillus agaradhaerens]MCR6118922.1 MFS transporter [Salipaludibacillus agaradhaerens]